MSKKTDTPQMPLPLNIFLIGMPSSGKTTVAKILAAKLRRKLVNIDAEIETREKMTISEIFSRHGEKYFRTLETKILDEVTQERGIIIDAGGGAAANIENHKYFKQNGVCVLLERDKKFADFSGRPLLSSPQQYNALQKYDKLYEERMPIYKKLADFTVNNDGEPQETATAIIEHFSL